MTVALTGSGGLFTRLGKLAKVLRGAHVYADGNLKTYADDAIAALGTEYAVTAALDAAVAPAQAAASQIGATVQQVAQAILTKMVNDDAPQFDRNDVGLALKELIRQMVAGGASVPQCTVSATPAAAAGNTGTGVVVATAYRPDGREEQNAFAEVGELECTGSAQLGTAAAGGEPWQYRGDFAAADALGHDWPAHSGASQSFTTVDSQFDAGLNLLTNSGFELFTATPTPDGWARDVGAATFGEEGAVVHRGAKAVAITSDGVGSQLSQTFGSGTPAVLRPNALYAFNGWLRLSAAAAAGAVSVSLLDGSGSLVADDAGANNSFSVSLPALATPTAYAPFSGVFRTPKALPPTVKLAVAVALLDAGTVLYLDSLALAPMTQLYAGGPSVAVFAGAVDWRAGDRYLLTVANDRASATYGSTWNATFDRFFSMREKGLVLPYSGSATIADTLITA